MKTDQPSKLRISIGGFFSSEYLLAYNGKKLLYTANEHGKRPRPKLIPVTQKDWDAFHRELDTLGVWNWQPYYDSAVCDGTQWEVQIHWGQKRCKSGGSNNYPENDGTPADTEDPNPTFTRFLTAISRLAGGEQFDC